MENMENIEKVAVAQDKSGISYQHIEQVGKTIATLEGCGNNLDCILWKLVGNNSNFLTFTGCDANIRGKTLKMKNRYRAVVKVNENGGDVYSELGGKEAAHLKVMSKYHKNLDANLRAFLGDVRNLAAGVEHYLDKKGVDYSRVPTVEQLKEIRFSVAKVEK